MARSVEDGGLIPASRHASVDNGRAQPGTSQLRSGGYRADRIARAEYSMFPWPYSTRGFKMAKAQKLPRIDEYWLCPEADGVEMCVRGGQVIQPGQPWRKTWAPGDEYAVGTYTTCMRIRQRKWVQAATYAECCLCGYLAKDAAGMAIHFRLIQHAAFGVSLDALMAA